jgi:hypothetical protein
MVENHVPGEYMPGDGVPAGMLDAATESWLMSLLRGETMISVPLVWIGPAPKDPFRMDPYF